METFVYSMGVISTLVSVICGVTLAYGGVNYMLSRTDVNVFQKGVFMVAWTYMSGVLGFLVAMTFPVFVVLLVSNDAKFDFSNVRKLLGNTTNVTYTTECYETQDTQPEDETQESSDVTQETSETSEESPVCQKSVCEKGECENECNVRTSEETKLDEETEKTTETVETKKTSPKTALELLQEEISKIQESVNDAEVMEKLTTTD